MTIDTGANFDTAIAASVAQSKFKSTANLKNSSSKKDTKHLFMLAGTLVSGIAALLASTMENKAANVDVDQKNTSGDNPDEMIDPQATGSLPNSQQAEDATGSSDIGPAIEIFESVSVADVEAAEIQLASLFGGIGNANSNDSGASKAASFNSFDENPEFLQGVGSNSSFALVDSLGVSDPAQPNVQIGAPNAPNQITVNNTPIGETSSVTIGAIRKDRINDVDGQETIVDENQNISGTEFSDTLIGANVDDQLFGLDGKDFLTGGKGGDHLDGGEGEDDVVEYVTSETEVRVSLKDGLGYTGDAEGDTLVNIEFVHGSLHDDWIEGDDKTNRLEGRLGNDELYGLDGNDRLLGGYGADLLDGGSGVDIADYAWSDEGVIVDLSTGIGLGGEAEGDILISIENLSGSMSNDTLIGDDLTNRLWGQDGNDILKGAGGDDRLDGGAGADILDGGSGIDIADYSNAKTGVSLSLASGGISGDAQGDSFISIENVYGSSFNDNIAGDDNANRLVGNAGDDVLFGAGGNDYFIGGAGNDVLIGGAGADVFVFEGEFGNDIIADMWTGDGRTDRIWLKDQGVKNWDDLQSHMQQSGDDIILQFDTGTLTLQDTLIEELYPDDFIYG